MSSQFEVKRISEYSYSIKFKDEKLKTVIVNIEKGTQASEIDNNHEFFFNLVNQYASNLFKSVKENCAFQSRVTLGDKDWVIKPTKKSASILSKFLTIFHKQGDDQYVRLKIERSEFFNPISLAFPGVNIHSMNEASNKEKLYNATTLAGFNLKVAEENNISDCKKYANMIPCSRRELKEGIRGKFLVTHKQVDSQSFFSNPYTILSSIAFQRFENEFSAHDYFKPEDCKYVLVQEKEELVLREATKQVKENKKANRETVQAYLNYLKAEFGEEKVAYAALQAQIDFNLLLDKGMSLTPEHVYRMNVLLNNVETEDLKDLLKRLPLFKEEFVRAWQANKEASLSEILGKMKEMPLINYQLRGILKVFEEKKLTTPEKFVEWLDQFADKKQLDELTPELFDQLASVFFLKPEQYADVFTGREIFNPIDSPYTTAGKKENKPWIDEQELLQVFPKIQNSNSWDLFNEKLGFVICKKHLFRKHPVKGYTTGALIPAPTGADGKKRWYKVAQALHNGYGTICYHLEPACNDPSLPVIKLYRSTSSDPYNIFGQKTIRLDMNPLATPGYEGKGRMDKYEEEQMRSRTIPIWVGYTLKAKEELKNTPALDQEKAFKIFHTLVNANKELHEYESSKVKELSLREIVRKHNGIINTLYTQGKISKSFYLHLRDDYLEMKASGQKNRPTKEKEKQDAKFLIEQILPFQYELDRFQPATRVQLKTQLDDLVKDLNEHEVVDSARKTKEKHINKMNESLSKNIEAAEQGFLKLIQNGNMGDVFKYLELWANKLEEYAKNIGENPESKEAKNILFVGHSLGGALAQVYTVHHMIEKGRMPCPGHSFNTAVFDAPGVVKEDNEKYKKFLLEHSDMFKANQVRFGMAHQHEAGDPLAVLGTHLGSANDLKEAGKIMLAFDFRACVMARNPNAKHHTVALATKAHGTQFLEAKEGEDYTKTVVDPYMLGLMESHETIQDLPKETVKEKGKKLRSEVWKFAAPISPQTINAIRGNPHLYYLAGKMFSNWVEQDEAMVPYLDAEGNFAANENGLAFQDMNFHTSTVVDKPDIGFVQKYSENKIKEFLYPGAELRLILKKLFHIPDAELNIKMVEFENKFDEIRNNLEAIGGNRISVKIQEGNIDGIILSPEKLMEVFADAGVEELKVKFKGQISTVYRFKSPKQMEILDKMKALKCEEMGWKVLGLSKGAILGDAAFLEGAKELSDFEILDRQVPKFKGPKKGAIICGGSLSQYELHAPEAMSFLLRGMSVMLYNPPGYGKSEGNPNQSTMTRSVVSVYDHFVKECDLKEEDVLIKSLCLSGGWASELARLHPKSALWLDQTYSDFSSLVETLIPSLMPKFVKQETGQKIGRLIPKMCLPSYDVASNLSKHQGPKCLMYSENDQVIPESHLLINLASIPANQYAHVIALPGQHSQNWLKLKNVPQAEERTALVKLQVDNFLTEAGFMNPLIKVEGNPQQINPPHGKEEIKNAPRGRVIVEEVDEIDEQEINPPHGKEEVKNNEEDRVIIEEIVD